MNKQDLIELIEDRIQDIMALKNVSRKDTIGILYSFFMSKTFMIGATAGRHYYVKSKLIEMKMHFTAQADFPRAHTKVLAARFKGQFVIRYYDGEFFRDGEHGCADMDVDVWCVIPDVPDSPAPGDGKEK